MSAKHFKSMDEKLSELLINNILSNAVFIGNRLNLFKTLAEISSSENPVFPEQLAIAAGCKERYVREWCNCLACGGIIEVGENEKFYIAAENVNSLTNSSFQLVCQGMMSALLEPVDQLLQCFRKDGPLGLEYSQFSKFQTMMSEMSESLHKNHLVSQFIPDIGNGIEDKLKSGIRVLDVGCGNGFHSALLAQNYPNSQFTGLDIGEDAISDAKKRCLPDGSNFKNLEFVRCDASKMHSSWTNSFDLVLIFDACHDQQRPDLCIKEIHRILKPEGTFGMLEVLGTSSCYNDRKQFGSTAAMMYGCSMFHCLPVGSNSPDALCYGAMWGRRRAIELIKNCGFENIRVVDTPYFPINVLYVSTK